jgi:diguanylate cyclase (GGDEF)-like protein/PAS domain S-box-containing protein
MMSIGLAFTRPLSSEDGLALLQGDGTSKRSPGKLILIPHLVFALCLIVPFTMLCVLIGRQWVEHEQTRLDSQITALVAGVSDDFEALIGNRVLILQTLASSPGIGQKSFASLLQQSDHLLAGGATGLLIRDPAGRVLLNTLATSGVGPSNDELAALPIPGATEPSRISNLVGADAGREPSLVIEIPVMRNGAPEMFLGFVLQARVFTTPFARNGIAGDLMGSIADRDGVVIGHSANSFIRPGQRVPGFAERTGVSGLWFGRSPSGIPLRVAYHRLPTTDFLINVGLTEAAFEAPLKRTLWTLGGLVVALFVGAFALSAPLLVRMLAAHRKLAETAELLSIAQEAAGAGLWDWDIDGNRVSLSAHAARMHGIAVPDGSDQIAVLSLAEWEARVFQDDLADVWDEVEQAFADRRILNAEFRTHNPLSPNGFNWVQTLGRIIYDDKGRPRRLIGLHLDMTARRETEEALRESTKRLRYSEERLMLALDSGEDGLFDWDIDSDELWLSERWRQKLGHDFICPRTGREWREAVHPDDREAFDVQVRQHLDGYTANIEIEYRRLCVDGSNIWILARGRAAGQREGRAVRVVGTLIDITRRKNAETRVAHMAMHDALTNLPNRNLFNRNLHEALRSAADAASGYAVLACDLDRFKAVNDTFGHPAGDRLLCLVAERIRTVVRRQDCVARLGGDEFALILRDITDTAIAERVCQRIINAIGEPILLDGNAIHVGISIGVAHVSGEGLSAEQVFRRADNALYQAKAAGRNAYRLYDAATHAQVATRSHIALDMKEAIRRGDFFLVYQPVIDIITERVSSFEALMRWNHPERGLISPGEFIPVAEETGLIVPLGAWALREACREAMRWPDDVRIGVNVSAVQFNGELEETVLGALTESGLPAGRLKLEVTESLLMRNPEQAFAVLHRLRDMGVRIALDDFGTGYSSLSYLRRFPFDKLKIDRAFVKDIVDPDAAAIVRAVVGIGERLGMGVVAEGVETLEQLDIVRREGCTEVQGFLFSKPLPPAEAHEFMVVRRSKVAS